MANKKYHFIISTENRMNVIRTFDSADLTQGCEEIQQYLSSDGMHNNETKLVCVFEGASETPIMEYLTI